MGYCGPMNARLVALVALVLVAGCKPRQKLTADAGLPDAGAALPAASGAAAPSATPKAPPTTTALPTDGCIALDADKGTGSDVDLEGKIETGRHGHPNGSSFSFYMLVLAKPQCVRGSDDAPTVKEVQVLSTAEPAIDFEKWVGKKVHVTGSSFPPETAYHVRPVVVDVKTLEKR